MMYNWRFFKLFFKWLIYISIWASVCVGVGYLLMAYPWLSGVLLLIGASWLFANFEMKRNKKPWE